MGGRNTSVIRKALREFWEIRAIDWEEEIWLKPIQLDLQVFNEGLFSGSSGECGHGST
jgi:hypothetical protein